MCSDDTETTEWRRPGGRNTTKASQQPEQSGLHSHSHGTVWKQACWEFYRPYHAINWINSGMFNPAPFGVWIIQCFCFPGARRERDSLHLITTSARTTQRKMTPRGTISTELLCCWWLIGWPSLCGLLSEPLAVLFSCKFCGEINKPVTGNQRFTAFTGRMENV